MTFVLQGKVFEFRELPFGLSLAPFVFTRSMAIISHVDHKRLLYLDDSLLRNAHRNRLLLQILVLSSLFEYFTT
jgi:hypothetical protein